MVDAKARESLVSLILLFVAFSPSFGHAAGLDLNLTPEDWAIGPESQGIFAFEDGRIEALRRSYESATLTSVEDFENFDLSFEFTLKRDCELILSIHAPRNAAYRAGLELVLADQPGRGPTIHHVGALLGHAAPKLVSINDDGIANTCRIHMDWPSLIVAINGEVVQDLDVSQDAELQYKRRRGAFVLRDVLGWGFEMGNFSFTALPDTENGIRLFNGKDFTGWREVRKGSAIWEIRDGVLVGSAGNGYLQHEALCQEFDLELYYRTSPTANGGVFFRWLTDNSDRGNEIQILDVPQTLSPSGSIYNIQRADDTALREGVWNFMQIRVRGTRAVTHLNGIKAAESNALSKVRPGHITLQMHKEESMIEFKDLTLVVQDGE